jgi:type VI secretion system protein ImpC
MMQYDVSFGRIGNAKRAAPGPAFRLAVLGDFSGRANAGILETGAKLAARKPLKVDVDNLDALIERLKITVSVPVDEDGNVITAPIKSMDDFHPDQLVENLPVFEELLQLRRNLGSKAGFDRAAKQVLSWSGEEMLPLPPRKGRGNAMATDRKLSDFARLSGRKPAEEADAEELIKRLVGPYIQPERDSRQDALIARVDLALSDAMRRVLHHPDFQNTEALWRGLEFLVRRIETDAKLQIVLYDISADELAADLAASDALDQSSLYSLFVEQPAMDANQGPLSMIAALYQFDLTPVHADLLGRAAQVAAAAGAPFFSSMAPDPLREPMHEWHPLIKSAWTSLRELPASAYLALCTPRFLLRMPYGKKTDPIDAFAFEEFTRQSGLSGMLWGHPAILAANLVAETWRRDSRSMKLGSIATAGDMPVYVFTDADGDQIALPCTERMLNERGAVQIAVTGVNPVVSIRGRPEVRLAGFNSLAGPVVAGRWAPVDVSAPAARPPAPAPATAAPAAPEPPHSIPASAEDTADLDALLASLDSAAEPEVATPPAAAEPAAAEEDDLDALLASLNAEPEPPAADETEPDLDALLASLK